MVNDIPVKYEAVDGIKIMKEEDIDAYYDFLRKTINATYYSEIIQTPDGNKFKVGWIPI